MSLLDSFSKTCVKVTPTRVSDGAGGFTTTYTESGSFKCAIALENTSESIRADKQTALSSFSILVDGEVSLAYGDIVKDSSGMSYRITSHPFEKVSPQCASFSLKSFTAERWVMPSATPVTG